MELEKFMEELNKLYDKLKKVNIDYDLAMTITERRRLKRCKKALKKEIKALCNAKNIS